VGAVKRQGFNHMGLEKDRWWDDQIYDYTLMALTDEIIELKNERAEARKLNIKHDCELIFNQYTELKE